MKQDVNYIQHHRNVNLKISELDLSSNHISVYNALFLIWNETKFDTELSINRNDVMKLSKIGSANTYTAIMHKLHEVKIINYKPSYNPLVGSKIEMYRFDKGTDKGSVKSSSNGCDNGTDNACDTLYKLLNNETIKLLNENIDLVNLNLDKWIKSELKDDELETDEKIDFEVFWNMYGNKTSRSKCEKKWNSLKVKEQKKIIETLPKFLAYKPFESYTHPNPETYLNQKRWEDELPEQKTTAKEVKIKKHYDFYYIDEYYKYCKDNNLTPEEV